MADVVPIRDPRRELELEQKGYAEIRKVLSDSFIADPVGFVQHFGVRPEDLSSAQLRAYYPHFLVQRLPLEDIDEEFQRRFLGGLLF